ncbi:MAG: hypothetical protein KDK78_10315, partial [Chlamydiia bacterium]|nr:hypothetical protein [Chlamydiia bacterium]
SLLDIKFVYPDRHLAATLLNEVMDGYREYLHSDNERKAEIQLAYLEKRQKETNAELSTLLLEHADAVASDLGSKGFADTEKEMAFLTQALAEIKKRSLNIQLELSHIDQAIAAGTQAYERYLCGGEPQVIQQLLGSIRALRQQRDTLDFALYRQKGIQSIASSDDSLKMHLDELSRLQEGIDEINMLRDCIRRGHSPSTSLKLVHLPNTWINQLFASTGTDTPPSSETKAMGREELEGYLSNLARVMQVQQDTVRKRLTYQKGSVTDYEGSDLPTVKALYLSCHTKLQELEALQRQYDFALTQLGDSTVDLSTCASVLTDPISREMITRAVDVQRLLQDDTTRSGKERERLEHQLELARSFLVQHIQQNLALSRENHQLLSEKLQVLREVTLDLLHQEISLQEKQFSDYLHSRREQLQHETELLTAREMELNQDLSALPRKWVSDHLVQQKLAQNQRVVEEITRLVESKNIAHNLEIIQSSPIDQAVAPILPRSSRVLLHAVTSLVFGSIIGLAFVIVRAIGSGMPATSNSMSMQGNRCLGQVPRRAPERAHPDELQTLRRICDFVLEKRIQGQGSSTVLCESSAPPFAAGIAHLLGQRGLKVVLIHLCGGPHTEKGFIPYLMGEADAPQALLENGYACIHAGQDSPFLHELLQSQRCTAYLAALKDAYDCVLIASRAKADSAECAAQIQLADRAILTIVDEKIDDTADFKRLEAQKPLGFVFARD